jgi:hypothetical protein
MFKHTSTYILSASIVISHCSTPIFRLSLHEGRAGEGWEPAKKNNRLSEILKHWRKIYIHFFFVYKGWAGHVARMGEERDVHRVLVGKPEGKSRWGDPDVDGRIILRWIFRRLE